MESRVHQKQQKRVRECLRDLEDEIEIAIGFLRQLRRHSKDSVSRISDISPNKQLEELSRVHSFLLKYLDAVSNVNWKFEIMELEGASDLNFYTNYNRDFEFYSKKSEMDEKKHEPPQKPFENIINKEQFDLKPPPYSEVVNSPKLIEFSNPSSDAEFEEIKEINRNIYQIKLDELESISFKMTCGKDVKYEGLPLKEDKNKPKNENLEENAKVSEKIEEIIEEISSMEIDGAENLEYKGFVEHVESPGEFYVHFWTKEIFQFETMKGIMQSLSSEINNVKYPYQDEEADFTDRKESAMEILGDYSLWYSIDESTWCRAKIIDYGLNNNDDIVKIFLFDFGDSKSVPLNQLKPLDNSLRKFPMFAQRCHLAGVYPLGCKSGGKMEGWCKESTELFNILANVENEGESSSSACKIIIGKNDMCHHPDSLPVILYTKDNVSVNDQMVNLDYAIRLDPPPAPNFPSHDFSPKPQRKKFPPKAHATPPVKNRDTKLTEAINEAEKNYAIDNWDPMKEDFDSYANNYDLDTNDPASYIYGYVPKDYERICHHYNRTGSCSKGPACTKEHVRLHPDGYTTDKEEVYTSAFNRLPPLCIGDTIKVIVCCVLNVDLFYCVRVKDSKSNEETLESLVDYINEEINVKCMRKLAVPPARGQIVIAKFSLDDKWYRARVLESCPDADEYELFFVDYGNKETKRLSSMRHIEPKYLHLPFQAMKCQLYNVGPKPDVNKKALLGLFNSFVHDKVLLARIMHLFPGERINLIVRLFDESYHDIGKELINKNLAVEAKSMKLREDLCPG